MADERKKVLKISNGIATIEASLKDKQVEGGTTTFQYESFADPNAMVDALVASAAATAKEGTGPFADYGETNPTKSGFNLRAFVFDRYLYGVDLKARAENREAVAAESTVVKVPGVGDVDLATLEPRKRIVALNASAAMAGAVGKEEQKAYATTRRRWLETKEVTLNVETGMLSMVKK